MENGAGKLKWVWIFEKLKKDIRDGAYAQGVPLPSEESLVRKFGVSRITAVRAMEELRAGAHVLHFVNYEPNRPVRGARVRFGAGDRVTDLPEIAESASVRINP